MTYFFGRSGIYIYIVTALIIANIQVVKTARFGFMDHPIALGTIVFSSLYLASDLLTERYGKSTAYKAVWLGFASSLMVTVFMVLTLGVPPVAEQTGVNSSMTPALSAHQAIATLFTPAPALFAASLISYIVSQYSDIVIFQRIRVLTYNKYLWLRTSVAAAMSALLDSIIFSTLAWIIFAEHPVSLTTLFYTYILGTYAFRIVIIALQTPVLYVLKTCLDKRTNDYVQ